VHGRALALSQLCIDRLCADPLALPVAVNAWLGADLPELQVAAPGLYRLHHQASGIHLLSLPIVVERGDSPLVLDVRPVPIGQPQGDDSIIVSLAVSTIGDVDAAHGYLRDVWAIDRRVDAARDAQAAPARLPGFPCRHGRVHPRLGRAALGTDRDDDGARQPGRATPRGLDLAGNDADCRRNHRWTSDATGAAAIAPVVSGSGSLHMRGLSMRTLLDQDFIPAFAAECLDHQVRATGIAPLAQRALAASATVELDRRRELLDTNNADVKSVYHTRRMNSSQLRVVEGRPAPAYSVRDLESGEFIANATFAGRT
jgi:hypothetical protein